MMMKNHRLKDIQVLGSRNVKMLKFRVTRI
jgi:hypothetical protein